MARKPATELTEEQKAAAKAEKLAAKTAKFEELARRRVPAAVDAMAKLRGLANKNNYNYSVAHVAAIFKALETELETLQRMFAPDAVSPAVNDLFADIKSGE